MKKTLLILSASLVLALSAGAAETQKIATIDLRKVFDGYWRTKQADLNLKDQAAELEKDRKSMVDMFQKGEEKYKSGKNHEACTEVPQTIPRSPGHDKEWFEMMKGGPAAYSNFDVAAYLTETILLGCIALRVGVGQKLDWDGPNMRARNTAAAEQFVKRPYRPGWEPA